MDRKSNLQNIKNIIRYMLCTASVITACYGFWGCLFPDLTLVEGTYRVLGKEAVIEDKEWFYSDILEGKVKVTYSGKLWEMIRSRCGYGND